MNTPRYQVAHTGEIPALPSVHPEGDWRPVRHHLGIGAFGANIYRAAKAGEPIIGEHDHAEDDDPHTRSCTSSSPATRGS